MSPTRRFCIAGEVMATEGDLLSDAWADFAALASEKEPVCRIRRARSATLFGVESVGVSHPIVHILRAEGATLLGDRDCTRLTLSCSAAPPEGLLLAGISARLSLLDTVLLHGALVEVPGLSAHSVSSPPPSLASNPIPSDGILFIGASGVGKSTQAELWQTHRSGRILNGDRVLVRMTPTDAEATGYGSPWAGSSPYRVNRAVRLARIVEVTRAPCRAERCAEHRAERRDLSHEKPVVMQGVPPREQEGSVRRLSPDEAMTALLCRALLPGWDAAMAGMTAAAAETVSRLARATPMFALDVPNGDPAAGLELLETYLTACSAGERSPSWSPQTAV